MVVPLKKYFPGATTYRQNRTIIVKGSFHNQEVKAMDDNQIIELFFARDEQAIQATDGKYGKVCLHTANNLLSSREDAEECVNDTYLTAWNQIPPIRPRILPAFLCKIVRNLSLKRLEQNNALKRSPEILISFDELSYVLPDHRIDSEMQEEQLGWIISEFLKTEKQESRNVFLRKYWFFDSISEISQMYGYSETKVKSMLMRTRNRLRYYLKKEGIYV